MKKIFLILATLITSVITFNIVTPDIKATDWCYTFNTNLIKGDRGSEVEALQIALNKEGFSVPSYGDQSIFGPLTQRAVISFQEKYKAEILTPLGLSSGTGKVGVATRAKLNALYGCVSAPVPAETPAPVAGNATSYTITGPTSGTVGVPVTLTLTPNGIYSGTISIGGGSFSPTSLTWSGDASAKTFTHTPTSN
ncbi:MAG: peptidoglycan-binding domain-containing protein, partial [Candidatus Gribaldobacteria bacterium]|nr:peptidoglycan-binding domain-containing protein [Candidatus Gribaldobacteria bacterium]